MDKIQELRERVRDYFPNVPLDLMKWTLSEIERLRAQVEELEREQHAPVHPN